MDLYSDGKLKEKNYLPGIVPVSILLPYDGEKNGMKLRCSMPNNAYGNTTVDMPLADMESVDKLRFFMECQGEYINSKKAPLLLKWLQDIFNKLHDSKTNSFTHLRLGWSILNEKKVFLWKQTVRPDGYYSYAERPHFLFSGGTEAAQEELLRTVVFPNENLTIGYAIGLLAALHGMIADKADIKMFVFNLVGESSTGKSTVSQLATSAFSYPQASTIDSLFKSCNATANALQSSMSNNYGLPIVLDDYSAGDLKCVKSLVFNSASGTGKSRLKSDGCRMQIEDGWSGTMLISSEYAISDDAPQLQGLKARVIPLSMAWTPDAQTAELIKDTVTQNYGFTGPKFAQVLEDLGEDKIKEMNRESRAVIKAMMIHRDNLSDRLEVPYSELLTTLRILEAIYGSDLIHPVKLIAKVIELEQAALEDRDISQIALQHLKDEMVRQKILPYSDAPTKSSEWGYEKEDKSNYHWYVPSETVKEFLASKKIPEFSVVKERLAKKNILIPGNDGHYAVKATGNKRFLHFVFPENPKKEMSSETQAFVLQYDEKALAEKLPGIVLPDHVDRTPASQFDVFQFLKAKNAKLTTNKSKTAKKTK